MTTYFRSIADVAELSTEKPFKADLFRSPSLFVGLNCFQRGQSQKVHVHAESDKFYLVLSGKARMLVGEETRIAPQGTIVWAPADVPHGVTEALEPTIMLVVMAPPPASISSPTAPGRPQHPGGPTS